MRQTKPKVTTGNQDSTVFTCYVKLAETFYVAWKTSVWIASPADGGTSREPPQTGDQGSRGAMR